MLKKIDFIDHDQKYRPTYDDGDIFIQVCYIYYTDGTREEITYKLWEELANVRIRDYDVVSQGILILERNMNNNENV